MVWYKAAWLPPMFAAFDQAFPARDRSSDGTIGDTAHQATSSGHNPDDTPGVTAERQDADNRPEVRAGDVDSTLRDPRGTTMRSVVNRVLVTPRDRNRLIYIICDGTIWRASSSWRAEVYTGSDRHYGHAHFSGHPDSDTDAAPWASILSFVPTPLEEPHMEQTDSLVAPWQANKVGDALAVAMETRKGLWVADTATGYGAPAPSSALGKLYAELAALRSAVADLTATVQALSVSPISQEAVDAAVLAAVGSLSFTTSVDLPA